jgi:hypothetical protein
MNLFSFAIGEIFRKFLKKNKNMFQKFFQVFKNGHLFLSIFQKPKKVLKTPLQKTSSYHNALKSVF